MLLLELCPVPSSCSHAGRHPAVPGGFCQHAKPPLAATSPRAPSSFSTLLRASSEATSAAVAPSSEEALSRKPLGVMGTGLGCLGEGSGALGEEECSWIIGPQKFWKTQGLWKHCWAQGLRPGLTCPGSELRFAVIPLEGKSLRPVFARLPEICSTLSHKPRKELTLLSRNIAWGLQCRSKERVPDCWRCHH